MSETFEAWIGFDLVLILLGTILGFILVWYAGGLAGIEKAKFLRSLLVGFFASAATYLISLGALMYGPPVKTVHGLALGLFFSLVIIMVIYNTSLLKALVPWLFFMIAQAIVILGATELFIGGLSEFLEMVQ